MRAMLSPPPPQHPINNILGSIRIELCRNSAEAPRRCNVVSNHGLEDLIQKQFEQKRGVLHAAAGLQGADRYRENAHSQVRNALHQPKELLLRASPRNQPSSRPTISQCYEPVLICLFLLVPSCVLRAELNLCCCGMLSHAWHRP